MGGQRQIDQPLGQHLHDGGMGVNFDLQRHSGIETANAV